MTILSDSCVSQVETLKKQLKEANDEKKKAERKRDVSEQRRCDAILEQGRIQTEADELATAVKKLTKAAQKGQQLDKGDVHKALRPLAAVLADSDAKLAAMRDEAASAKAAASSSEDASAAAAAAGAAAAAR